MAVSVLDAWSATADSDPTGSPTISAGSNRCFILALVAENSAADLVVSTITVGGEAPTQTYEHYVDNGGNDHVVYVYLWDEVAITNMSGTAISYTDNRILSKRGFATATYQDVNQTSFPKGQDTVFATSDTTTFDVPTTSVSGDRIIVVGMNRGVRTHDNWDTLTEQFDAALNTTDAQMGGAEGNGGDDTTTVTISGLNQGSYMGIVLGAVSSIVPVYYNLYIQES